MPGKSTALKKAFTLIELLVVIGIISILSGAVLYATDNAREKGRDKARKDGLEAIRTAAVGYYSDHKQFPSICNDPDDAIPDDPELSDCEQMFENSADTTSVANLDNQLTIAGLENILVGGGYMESLPLDPNQIRSSAGALASLPSKIASWFTNTGNTDSDGQVAGLVSCNTSGSATTCTYKIENGSDDGMGWHDGSENNTGYSRANSQGLLIGRRSDGYYYKPSLRFDGVGNNIPAGSIITSAKLKLWPKSSGNPANWPTNVSTPVHTRITSDMFNQPSGQFAENDYSTFIDHLVDSECCPPSFAHVSTVYDIPQWNSDSTQQEVTVTEVVQEEVNNAGWQSGRPIHFIWYAQDSDPPGNPSYALAANKGRVFHSFESDPNKAPVLEITYNTPTIIACEAEGFTLNPNTGPNNGYAAIDPGGGFPASYNHPQTNPPYKAIWRGDGGQEDLGPGASPGLGTATKQIYVSEAGTYSFWARVRYFGITPFANSDSFWLKIDSGSYIAVGNENNSGGAPAFDSGDFHWVNFVNNDANNKITANLSVGLHTIELRVREDGNKIDKILLVKDAPSYIPSNSGPTYGPAENCPTSGGGPVYQCSDTLDNDSDTFIDYPADVGCDSSTDNDEVNTSPPVGSGPPTVPEGDEECENECKFVYQLRHDKKWFRIWVFLENPSDPQRVGGPNAICNPTQAEINSAIDPAVSATATLYCIESPPI